MLHDDGIKSPSWHHLIWCQLPGLVHVILVEHLWESEAHGGDAVGEALKHVARRLCWLLWLLLMLRGGIGNVLRLRQKCRGWLYRAFRNGTTEVCWVGETRSLLIRLPLTGRCTRPRPLDAQQNRPIKVQVDP